MSERQATYEELKDGGLSEQLGYLRVSRYGPATYGLWAVPEWGMASVDLADLSRQIAAKELKVPTYRQSCDEVWLVVYGLAHISGAFDMEALRDVRVASSFDQVVFLDAVSREYEFLAG